MKKRLSILLASDNLIFSTSLIALFNETGDLQLAGCAVTTKDLLFQVNRLRPGVVLVEIALTRKVFASLLTSTAGSGTKILVINQDMNPTQTVEALQLGAHGVLGRETTPELLCRSIRAVASGDIWVARGVTAELVGSLRSGSTAPSSEFSMENRFHLTKREVQIINALVEAQTNKDIAETFGISEYTVKHHLTNIFDKLGVYNRVELALFATHHRICPSGIAHAYSTVKA